MKELSERNAPDSTRPPHWAVPFADSEPASLSTLDAPDMLAAMLDEVDYPMLLVDASMRLLWANRAARRNTEGVFAFTAQGAALQQRSHGDHDDLGRAVEAACGRGTRSLVRLGAVQGTCDTIAVVPQPHSGGNVALLMCGRANLCEELSMAAYARSHGLTAGEARVLGALCAGESAVAIAKRHGVAISTVRTQLNSLRAKTGAKGIGDLLRQVALLPPLVNALRLGRGRLS